MKPINKIIPATPGFSIVEPLFDENNSVVEAEITPIIAWAFLEMELGDTENLSVHPVTPFNLIKTDCPSILEEKSGRIFSFISEFDTIEAWIEGQNSNARNRVRLDNMLTRKRNELGITKPKSGGENVV